MFVCKIPLLARRTRPSARATIGYLVYKSYVYIDELLRTNNKFNTGILLKIKFHLHQHENDLFYRSWPIFRGFKTGEIHFHAALRDAVKAVVLKFPILFILDLIEHRYQFSLIYIYVVTFTIFNATFTIYLYARYLCSRIRGLIYVVYHLVVYNVYQIRGALSR